MNWSHTEQLAINGKFIGSQIRQYILENTLQRVELTREPNSYITTYLFRDGDISDLINHSNQLLRQTADFVQKYRTSDEDLRIYWFPTPFKKTMPEVAKESLDVDEINSACTFHYPNNRFISLYRYEEAPKVLFHELIHFYHLDLPLRADYDTYIIQKYNIRAPCILKETYSEIVGCLLNIDRVSNDTGIPFQVLYSIEEAFMLYQVQKILNYYHVHKIADLGKIKSDTNLITYFPMKLAFLLAIDNPEEYLAELKRRKLVIENPQFIIDTIEKGLVKLFSTPSIVKDVPPELTNTLRMTIVQD